MMVLNSQEIPLYVADRIRRPIPQNLCVVPGSTPVIAFGDSRKARVATLGLNPSKKEFLGSKDVELPNATRRLETHRSLSVAADTLLSEEAVAKVFAACNGYFHKNPYCAWFDQLESILLKMNVSFYDGSACHLDLVQWATAPTWGDLQSSVKVQLLRADKGFLRQQLIQENIELLLLNGNGVKQCFESAYSIALQQEHEVVFERTASGHEHNTQFFTGEVFGKLRVISWSTNIQSSFGVTNTLRQRIGDRVGELVRR